MMIKNKERICLIGMPGSGKSTVGKLLSEKLKYSFFDTDEEIEKKEKTKIKNIFSEMGEDYFRSVETSIFDELMNKDKIVFMSVPKDEILKSYEQNTSRILTPKSSLITETNIPTLKK